ncbi:MAG: hypothetical protein A2600_09665 [Candidatus Lambdaproteobacteria bacterium RIFOXYD1_FULL_56_27]|uniref:TVP38/TMEM64 family membrane protein n=1 Tax=Candidatus Lambdaproteobacteria bacterium RIFOXYD2_FULL_56_26 TaxID=1817773 RepID=A0A1F6GUU3_9PROT|nr:MAG: hypothetical protein A2557_04935 [Candidatus Lambdaproteobacteria bacterium RIFOXYD2_FULL_56_26]OGH02311.1 MAG: hypothetical protein A2426_03415 [Candidatus Lambdaproteobacteria bacterium RIFOXYC1_FULL_56_13]OGH10081.1 MAG: hypothetical protein A2600_09665 [Candidatus Lambdaproteobacteria bacterium RIFOXYD1_FULL_56_27]
MNRAGKMALGLALFLVPVAGLYRRESLSWEALALWLQELGWAGPLGFILLYGLGTLLWFPGSILTLLGGAVFGLWAGTLYTLTGATLGVGLAFLTARFLVGPGPSEKCKAGWGNSRPG